MDIDGKVNSTTFAVENEDFGDIRAFAESMADSQVIKGYHFFKIYDNQAVEYVLVARGSNEDAYMIGRVAAVSYTHLYGGNLPHKYAGSLQKQPECIKRFETSGRSKKSMDEKLYTGA